MIIIKNIFNKKTIYTVFSTQIRKINNRNKNNYLIKMHDHKIKLHKHNISQRILRQHNLELQEEITKLRNNITTLNDVDT